MKKKSVKTNQANQKELLREKTDMEQNLVYPPGEDMYNKGKQEENIDIGDTSKTKEPNEKDIHTKNNEKDFEDDKSGSDLDVPGSELDDEQENVGNEDEENNYYSLGGDNHNDLDEDKGE